MHSKNSKLTHLSLVAAAMVLAHCSGNGLRPVDVQVRTAALGRMKPLVTTVSNYADTLSVAGAGQPTAAAMQAANTLGSALVPGTRLPVDKILRTVKSVRSSVALPDTTVADFLNSHVFTAENVESVSGDTTTYLLHGSAFCPDANQPSPSACIDNVDKMAIRLVVTNNGQDQNIAVQVGASGDVVANVGYNNATQALSVDGDLAQVQAVLATLGRQDQGKADGHISIAFSQTGAKQASATVGFASAIHAQSKDSNVTFAAAPQAFSISANDTTWSVAVSLAAVDVAAPLHGSDGNVTQPVTFHIAGLTGSVSGDASSQGEITIVGAGVGAGPATVTQNGQTLLQVELNADANHSFDLTASAQDANGSQTLTVSPKLTATVQAAMAPLATQTQVAQELLKNNYGVALTNDAGPAVLKTGSRDLLDITDGTLQVVNGQLALTSDQGNVTVPAGQCLAHKQDATNGPSWVTEQEAAACN